MLMVLGSGGTSSLFGGVRLASEPRLEIDLRNSVGDRGGSGVPDPVVRDMMELIWSDSVANDPRLVTVFVVRAGDGGTSRASDIKVDVKLGLRPCRFSGRRETILAAAAA